MQIQDALTIARAQMNAHGLHHWSLTTDNAVRRFGQTRYDSQTISLSKPLTECNEDWMIRDTILHEIAHALAGHTAGHGPEWKRIAKKLGAIPRAHSKTGVTPEGKYVVTCQNCGYIGYRMRRPKGALACAACCNKFNRGRFSRLFELVVEQNY